MAQLVKKFITDDAVADEKIRLDNNSYLRARNAADSGDINLLKVNASDIPEFGVLPIYSGSNLATENYVTTALSGAAQVAKQAVIVVAISDVSLTGEQTIDGVLTSTSRVLLAGQTDASENGIYVTAAGAWARSSDANVSAEVIPGMMVYVASGTSYGETIWVLDTTAAITLDTTNLSFVKKTLIPNKQSITLAGGDITNQYVDLAFSINNNSLDVVVSGLVQRLTTDYTLSVVSGVTRVTFAGDLATGGNAALVAGDVMYFKYSY